MSRIKHLKTERMLSDVYKYMNSIDEQSNDTSIGPIHTRFYYALQSATRMEIGWDRIIHQGNTICMQLLHPDYDINVTAEMPEGYNTFRKDNIMEDALSYIVNGVNNGLQLDFQFTTTVSDRDATTADDSTVKYGWKYAFPFLNSVYKEVYKKPMVGVIHTEFLPTNEDLLHMFSCEEFVDVDLPDEKVLKTKEPEVKIYRTDITLSNDPYWKNLDRKWKLK